MKVDVSNSLQSLIFFERPTNPPNRVLAKFTITGYTRLLNWGKPSPRAEAREHSPEGTIVQ
ncbi:hypothetical protein Hanom_Chr10g00895421 [Helianthus anomalus]